MNDRLSSILLEAATSHGLTDTELIRQIELFRKGITPVHLVRACTPDDGIVRLDSNRQQSLIDIFNSDSKNLNVVKFVPASGAASRMFKDLQAMLNDHDSISDSELNKDSSEARFAKQFIENIKRFPFFDLLSEALKADGHNLDDLIQNAVYRPILEYTLTDKGLNYASLPKALIQFHAYSNTSRTALEEHFHESKLYGKDNSGKINVHFTVSPEFEGDIRKKIEIIKSKLEDKTVHFDVDLSFQESSTDTIAVDLNNEPFKDESGKFLFRPGGHGALLHNLNTISGDVVFIKNIDNVVPDFLKPETEKWKKCLGGYLIELRARIFGFLNELDDEHADLDTIRKFCEDSLQMQLSTFDLNSDNLVADFRRLLNRPIRVCGMVKNEGEPGGGPFWVELNDGTISRQIVESSQINLEDENQRGILQNSTHFNPVDIVCSLADYKGNSFDLESFSNPETAFIAEKSSAGKKLKALERPGLWNGAMEKWVTIFVEVPIETFNPVKTINDLLRPQHQPK